MSSIKLVHGEENVEYGKILKDNPVSVVLFILLWLGLGYVSFRSLAMACVIPVYILIILFIYVEAPPGFMILRKVVTHMFSPVHKSMKWLDNWEWYFILAVGVVVALLVGTGIVNGDNIGSIINWIVWGPGYGEA